jgi:hypothetical protein
MTDTDQMAAQLAQLLTGSDRAELEEIVRRWKLTAGSAGQRRVMDKMADQILELRAALDQSVAKPAREELELALKMMLRLASEQG